MPRRIHLQPHLSVAELARRYRTTKEPNERTWWQILWLLAQGRTATELAAVTGYRAYWIGQIAKRYNEQGPAGMVNRRHTTSYRPPPVLAPQVQEALRRLDGGGSSAQRPLDGGGGGRLDGGAARAAGLLPAGLELSGPPQAQPAGAPATACAGRRRTARDLQKNSGRC